MREIAVINETHIFAFYRIELSQSLRKNTFCFMKPFHHGVGNDDFWTGLDSSS